VEPQAKGLLVRTGQSVLYCPLPVNDPSNLSACTTVTDSETATAAFAVQYVAGTQQVDGILVTYHYHHYQSVRKCQLDGSGCVEVLDRFRNTYHGGQIGLNIELDQVTHEPVAYVTTDQRAVGGIGDVFRCPVNGSMCRSIGLKLLEHRNDLEMEVVQRLYRMSAVNKHGGV